jgi:pyruvate/2-oxoglutarate dehydrogenase complex dihydrolipoamide dehydrogenase (E3) component
MPGYDLVIVGMGSGGIVAAEFAAKLRLRVAVVERDRIGGDCLWTGCVPSKSLLASAKVAHHMRTADEFGIESVEPSIDRARVWHRVRSIQQQIAESDDHPDRFRELGCDVVTGHGRLTSPTTVDVDGRELSTRYVLLATGSHPVVPPIEGLTTVGFVTSESIFTLTDPPASFVNIGGGPIAVEMAQAFARLDISCSLLQRGPRVLPRDDPTLVDRLVEALREEGVAVAVNVETQRVSVERGMKVVHGTEEGKPARWAADEILVAVGRRPSVDGLGLEELGIKWGPKGIAVDDRGRTSIDTVYACGDVAGRYLFTHSAAYEAARMVRDMFFPGTGRLVASVPWCTFTDPELAHAGLTEAVARERFGADVEVWRRDLAHNDRARSDGATLGAVVLVTRKRRLVGAHVLAPAAGELIHELAVAIEKRVKLDELSQLIHVYPTVSTSIWQLAGDAALQRAEKLTWLVRRRS